MNTQNKMFNPFPGLRAFEEDEDILFFGREKQVDDLLRKLRGARFLAIIGSSGSGKSSLVKSGMLPALYSGLMSGVSSQWRMAIFRPGNDPVGQLNEALSADNILRDVQTDEERSINTAINETILRRSNMGLIELYRQSGLDKKNNLLILVDQFEEIFRFSKYEKEEGDGKRDSITFINLLLKAIGQKEFPIYVVFTMRSDFLGDCTEFRGLPEAINDGQYLVPRMTRDERRDAITGPIAVGGAAIAPALLNRLLNDVGDSPDQLPIMQHAMMRTWDEWKHAGASGPLDVGDYERIGTISDALSLHAEEAYNELGSDKVKMVCQTIFKELTEKGGMLSGIRRPRKVSELCVAAGASLQDVIAVIDVFRKPGRGFLMPASPIPLTESSIIDISHESIMRVWKRLIAWLEEEAESAKIYLALCDNANLYEQGKGGLLHDPELQIALKWKEEQHVNAAWAQRYNNYFGKVILFLEQSRQMRDQELRNKEELQKQRLRLTRRITAIVGAIALIAFVAMAVAMSQYTIAKKSEKVARESARSDSLSKIKADISANIARWSAIAANASRDSARDARAFADSSLKLAVISDTLAHQQTRKANNEERLARAALGASKMSDSLARISAHDANENLKQATKNLILAKHNEAIADSAQAAAYAAKNLAASKNEASSAKMYINNDYNKLRSLSLKAYNDYRHNGGGLQDNDVFGALFVSWRKAIKDSNVFKEHSAPVRSVVCLPKHGSTIVFSGDEDGAIVVSRNYGGILKDANGKKHEMAGDEVRQLVISKDGAYLLAILLQEAVLYKIVGETGLQRLTTTHFAGYGRHGAFLGSEGFIVQTGTEVKMVAVMGNSKSDSLMIPDCGAIAVNDKGVIYVSSGGSIRKYAGWGNIHAAPVATYNVGDKVTGLCLDASGSYLAAGTNNGNLWIKELGGVHDGILSQIGYQRSKINDLKFSGVFGNSLQLSSASSDRTVKMVELTKGFTLDMDNVITMQDHSKWVYSLDYSPDGNYLFSGGEDETLIACPTTMKYIYNSLAK